jgi:hypothetical protein
VEGGSGAAAEAATTAFVAVVPDMAAGVAEVSTTAEEPDAPGVATACPAATGLRGAGACRGCSAARHEGADVVSERETEETTGLRRSVKRKSGRRGDGSTTGDEATIC